MAHGVPDGATGGLLMLSGFGGEPAWLDGIRHTLTLDCARARQALGWAPRRDVGQTLAAMIAP